MSTVSSSAWPQFAYLDGALHVENVPLARIAACVGTPAYVYSRSALEANFDALDRAFSDVAHLICYSVKANANLGVLRTFAHRGSGFDIVSHGELYRVQRAGGDLCRVVFSGVGKSEKEIRAALQAGILCFHVESLAELEAIEAVAAAANTKAPVALRVNPDVDARTHPYISTGLRKSKFGVPMEYALEAYDRARHHRHLEVIGIDCHIGSQLTDLSPFRDALSRVRELWETLSRQGYELRLIDVGGGLGIRYRDEQPPTFAEYARTVKEALQPFSGTIVVEPGRSLVGNAGVLLTQVQYLKTTGERNFIVVDAAMNDLIRPSLYGSYQEILAVRPQNGAPIVADIVGPVCESGDFLGKDREFAAVSRGDLLAVMSAGAYGFVMSSNYNARPRAAEVLVDGDRFAVVRERETLADLTRGEQLPEWLE